MKVTFVSHASILIEASGHKILTDPWDRSKVFNESWALLSPPAKVDYGDIDALWISHEHPDHLNFPTLRSIPEEQRAQLPVYYQKHASRRISDVLVKMGFKEVVELPLYRWHQVKPGLRLFCGSIGAMDSFLAVEGEGQTLLNLNDCVLNETQLTYLRKRIGSIDALFTQFSFANWVGNDHDEMGQAAKKRRDLKLQKDILSPKYIVPFASYVYFCNQENERMNAWINRPKDIAALGIENINFMYPGDQVDLESPDFTSDQALAKYESDIDQRVIDPTPPSQDVEVLCAVAREALVKLRKDLVSRIMLSSAEAFSVHIKDLGQVIFIDPRKFKVECRAYAEAEGLVPRFEMVSQVFHHWFKFPWGANALFISGMYKDREYAQKGTHPLIRIQNWMGTDVFNFHSLPSTFRTLDFFWQKRGELRRRYAKGSSTQISA